MLDRRRVERFADPREQRFARVAVHVEHADLDQLVRLERDLDLREYGRREPVLADRDDRMEMVRGGAAGAPLRGC